MCSVLSPCARRHPSPTGARRRLALSMTSAERPCLVPIGENRTMSSEGAGAPRPVRTTVREAIREAWQRAIDEGSLPPLPEGTAPIEVEVERPADPGHGD